ncbi:MAG: uL15 family ribosomal protein [Patescibacteria group bacterium]
MKLHQIKLKVRKRSKQRIARGGKRGSYSGRGVKGQKSRSGRKLRPAQRDLILRIPKLRGFRNKAKKNKPIIFNLKDLYLAIKTNSVPNVPLTINKEFLVRSGMVSLKYTGEIRILSQGDIDAPLSIEGISVSKRTREKIEKANGKIL